MGKRVAPTTGLFPNFWGGGVLLTLVAGRYHLRNPSGANGKAYFRHVGSLRRKLVQPVPAERVKRHGMTRIDTLPGLTALKLVTGTRRKEAGKDYKAILKASQRLNEGGHGIPWLQNVPVLSRADGVEACYWNKEKRSGKRLQSDPDSQPAFERGWPWHTMASKRPCSLLDRRYQ